MIQRIDELAAAAEIGRYYLVPTVFYPWFGRRRAWPVIGPRHEDTEHINYPHWHYHVDGRFLSAREWAAIDKTWYGTCVALARSPLFSFGEPPHLAPIWKRLMARRQIPYQTHHLPSWLDQLECAYADKSLVGPTKICPHRGAPLAGIVPDENGIVTCPLHGLRWHADTGELIRST